MGHTHPTSQRRPHTHTHSARTQPPIRSATTTTTNRPQVSHSKFYTRGRALYPRFRSPQQIYSPPRQIAGREAPSTWQMGLAAGGDRTAPVTPAVWLRLTRNSQRKN